MNRTPAHSTTSPLSSPSACRFARRIVLAGIVAGLCAASLAHGALIPVPNGSFENPTTTFVNPTINNWTKTSQPFFFDPVAAGFSWDQTSGVFVNTASGNANHIDNLDQNQAAFIIGIPTAGFFQDLSAVYTVGIPYTMNFGTISEAPAGDTLTLTAYYRDALNNIVPIATDTVTSLGNGVPNITTLQYSGLTIPTVSASDPWAGKTIGVLVSVGQGTGGDWDVDNVTVVPEPASAGLLVLGVGLLLQRRRRIA